MRLVCRWCGWWRDENGDDIVGKDRFLRPEWRDCQRPECTTNRVGRVGVPDGTNPPPIPTGKPCTCYQVH